MLRFLLITLMSLTVSGCYAIRYAKTLTPDWSGFVEISKDIYVDKAMSSSQRIEVLKTVRLAKVRVSQFFGGLEGHPKIFACSSEECFVTNDFGATPKGMAFGSSALMLSPRGMDIVIISHELTHIELHTRVGVFRSWHGISTWFDEGLAVLVSQDPRYTKEAWLKATEDGRIAPALNAITWGKGSWLLSYGTARRAVGEWYSRAKYAGLISLIAEVKNGAEFETTFSSISSKTASNPSLQRDAPQAARP